MKEIGDNMKVVHPSGSTVRGSIIVTLLKYVKKKWGKNGLHEFMTSTSMDPNAYEEIGNYSSDEAMIIMDWIDTTHGRQELQNLGRFTAQDIGLKRYLSLVMSIKFLVKAVKESNDRMMNYGSIEIEEKNGGFVVTITDIILTDTLLEFWTGIFEGIFIMSRRKGTVTANTSQMTEGVVTFEMK